jgi:hypothetical protein
MNIEDTKLLPKLNARAPLSSPAIRRVPISTQFGNIVDVRNRGALRVSRFAGNRAAHEYAPAVVRMWSGDTCRELTIDQARALAAQLLEAARYAELQNTH